MLNEAHQLEASRSSRGAASCALAADLLSATRPNLYEQKHLEPKWPRIVVVVVVVVVAVVVIVAVVVVVVSSCSSFGKL